MAYKNKQSRGRINLQKSSLEILEAHLPNARRDVLSCETNLTEFSARRLNGRTIEDIRTELEELNRQIALFNAAMKPLEVRQPKKGLMGSFFGVEEWPAHLESQWRALYAQKLPFSDRRHKLSLLEEDVQEKENDLRIARSWLSRLETAVSRKRKKNDSLLELRASAASNVKETREVGATVRRGLNLQPWCPYCGGSLGSDPHADHIYPVSKGGRSVPKNMVYVCAKCNIMKSNLTLTGFIKKYSLDRDIIEERLGQLHKDF